MGDGSSIIPGSDVEFTVLPGWNGCLKLKQGIEGSDLA
jgi:hypothetical protein